MENSHLASPLKTELHSTTELYSRLVVLKTLRVVWVVRHWQVLWRDYFLLKNHFVLFHYKMYLSCFGIQIKFYFFKDYIYLFMRDREAKTQAEGEAGSIQGA